MKLKKRMKSYGSKPLTVSMEELNYYVIDNGGMENDSIENIRAITMKFLNQKVKGKITYLKEISQVGDNINFRYVAEKLSPLKLA